ncbi:MAG: ADP-ribosylglycohydrolase family protein [Syntrophaceae bacterium]|nr:ADP-ribosylglycohydrolase family protein [Syntrophaceae bacterium]
MERLLSKFIGALVGGALGDAIGEKAFRCAGREALLEAIAGAGVLRWTDDTAMSIGLAESICDRGGIDPQHLGDTFRRRYGQEPWRGYASGPPAVFAAVESEGLSYEEAARTLFGGRGSLGNGAAMRVAPAGLFYHDAPDLYERAAASAAVTHAHPVGIDGAAVLAKAVAVAATLDPANAFPQAEFLETLVGFSRTHAFWGKIRLVRELLQKAIPPGEAATRLGRSVAVDESLPFALYAFLLHPGSYRECLLCAVLEPGDRDTVGAMAGALSGAYLGVEAIPAAWRGKLEAGPAIEELARRLFRAWRAPPSVPG